MTFRIGYGCDIHRFAEDRPLVLCGVAIPCEKGLLGHSDADAGIHAVIDSLLGALALGDIGGFFPDTDPAYKDVSSLLLLKEVLANKAFESWNTVNCDLTLITEKPRLAPYIDSMRSSLAAALGVEKNLVSVKAKTNEKLGEIGRFEALEARALVLLEKKTRLP